MVSKLLPRNLLSRGSLKDQAAVRESQHAPISLLKYDVRVESHRWE